MIPAGIFLMGERGNVTLSQPFSVTTTEVTEGLWKSVMGRYSSIFTTCGDACPVANVSIAEIQAFIQSLNARSGKSYRLLTEAEWEYACRSGGIQNYCGSDNLDEVGWHSLSRIKRGQADNDGSNGPEVHSDKLLSGRQPVKGRSPNAFGLYDMTGNVWELVSDCWHESHIGAPQDGHQIWGEEAGGDCSRQVLRGGSWFSLWSYCYATSRDSFEKATTLPNLIVGFRLARKL